MFLTEWLYISRCITFEGYCTCPLFQSGYEVIGIPSVNAMAYFKSFLLSERFSGIEGNLFFSTHNSCLISLRGTEGTRWSFYRCLYKTVEGMHTQTYTDTHTDIHRHTHTHTKNVSKIWVKCTNCIAFGCRDGRDLPRCGLISQKCVKHLHRQSKNYSNKDPVMVQFHCHNPEPWDWMNSDWRGSLTKPSVWMS